MMHFGRTGPHTKCLLVCHPTGWYMVSLEHKVWWAVKQCNMKLDAAGQHMKLQLQELEEIRNDAYGNSLIYKEKTKAFHDITDLEKEL